MGWFKNAWKGFRTGKTPVDVYIDDGYAPVTEEDWEADESFYAPISVNLRRRWLDHKPDRKVVGYR